MLQRLSTPEHEVLILAPKSSPEMSGGFLEDYRA